MIKLLRQAKTYRHTIWISTTRDINQKLKSGKNKFIWLIGQPLLSILLYTFIFTKIFQPAWNTSGNTYTSTEYALVIFIGLTASSFIQDTLSKSTGLIQSNSNLVKKVRYPLELLCISTSLEILTYFAFNLASILVLCTLLFEPKLSQLPAIILPVASLAVISLAIGWAATPFFVYFPQFTNVTQYINMVITFMSPVFYPASAVPTNYRWIVSLNPLTTPIEQLRAILIYNTNIEYTAGLIHLSICIVLAYIALHWFRFCERGFSDVI